LVSGVLMSDGTELSAPIVVSGANPYHTFLELLPVGLAGRGRSGAGPKNA
jgi:hypothetical protein